MLDLRSAARLILVAVASAVLAAPVTATTLVRRGLEELTAGNELIVQAKVLDIHSYWNDEHTFIFTDVHVRPLRHLKGAPAQALHERAVQDLSFTLMGGTVGETTTLLLGGPDLAPGAEYVLFLGRSDLPGAPGRLTVRDLSQGAFEVRHGRAWSQAIGEPLLPDALGETEVPGGPEGLLLETLSRRVLELR